MIPIDLSGKVALVTGVSDNESFAWSIAKTLQAAGANVIFAVHPRVTGIVEMFLSNDQDAEARILPSGKGS
jgi:enoyl-[acyl-carrier protein] reductase I